MCTLRMSTAGESHGAAELCLLEGVPAGLALDDEYIDKELARRTVGYGRGGRMAIERDKARILAGVRLGRTLGSPIAIAVDNRDHVNWLSVMAVEALSGEAEGQIAPVTVPRPGHADYAGAMKYGHRDLRNVLERASARETVARVAGGAVCKRLLEEVGVAVRGRVVRIGPVSATGEERVSPDDIDWAAVEASDVACDDPVAAEAMRKAIDEARAAGESLGGVFEIWCWGVCPGVGGYATPEERLDALLLWALGSIPGIKGVEIGAGFAQAALPGSLVHDPFCLVENARGRFITRRSNRAGGLEGGVTNGMPLVLRAAMKPIPTLTSPLDSVDLASLKPTKAHVERSDIAAVPAARVVGEAMVAYVLARAYLAKFGGDSMDELVRSVNAYEGRLEERGLWRRS